MSVCVCVCLFVWQTEELNIIIIAKLTFYSLNRILSKINFKL